MGDLKIEERFMSEKINTSEDEIFFPAYFGQNG